MRSESTSAFGHPSDTNDTFGATPGAEEGSGGRARRGAGAFMRPKESKAARPRSREGGADRSSGHVVVRGAYSGKRGERWAVVPRPEINGQPPPAARAHPRRR